MEVAARSRPVEITVERELRCPPAAALRTLRDVARYPAWWPLPVALDAADARRVRVGPLPLVRIVLQRIAAEEGRDEVVFRYVGGPFRGRGVWSVEPGDDPGTTHVRYAIRLRPVNPLVALAARTAAFRAKHVHDIRSIMARLEDVAGGG